MKKMTIALAGNPNSGKTTIFNNLTGARQHVGNYPGVTVEKKEGTCSYEGRTIHVVDLPGTYSLTAYSMEEIVARNFVVDERPDVVIDILDASNLERNLYLATQFMELGVPLVLALNMSDVAKKRGHEIDLDKLSKLLRAPLVPTVGHKNRGTQDLLSAAVAVAEGAKGRPVTLNYGKEMEDEIGKIQALLERRSVPLGHLSSRWTALKLLENDSEVRAKLEKASPAATEIISEVEKSSAHIESILGDMPEIIIADRRYGFISGACQEAVKSSVEFRHTVSDKIDSVLTNRVLGLPIFLGLMFLVFHLVFTLGTPPMEWIDSLFGQTGDTVSGFWPKGSDSILKSLLVDGIIAGVGGVIIFLPNILLLFLAIAFLEDSGYMARAAFIMDRIMHKIGLHGKSFIPLLIGIGCTIPAIMATRTLESRRDRLTTMLVAPLISCGARLPIYLLIIPAFFPQAWTGPMLWIIYIIGIVVAVIAAKLLRSTLFKGESTPFVMELPPYRIPTLKGIIIHMWERAWLYLKKAGTIILLVSVILWAMTSFPKKAKFDMDYDALAENAQTEYLAEANKLNTSIGLPEDSELITASLKAELEMEEEQDNYYEDQPGFSAAEKAKDKRIEELAAANRESYSAAQALLDTRDKILAVRDEFDRRVEEDELEEDTDEYEKLEAGRDAELSKLKSEQPVVYAAASALLDKKGEYEEALENLSFEQSGEELTYSIAGSIGHGIEPVLSLMGFDWRIGTALIGAFAAKEVFVAQMGIVYSLGEADEESEPLRETLRKRYNPLIGFCIMLFCLISAPCMATIAVTKREANSWGWALFQLAALTVLALVLTAIVYQVGSLLGIGL